jgi:hypothetical protein
MDADLQPVEKPRRCQVHGIKTDYLIELCTLLAFVVNNVVKITHPG